MIAVSTREELPIHAEAEMTVQFIDALTWLKLLATIILWCSAYDKDQNFSGHLLFSTNSINYLTIYGKFVWPSLICQTYAYFGQKLSCDWPLS